MGIRTRGQGRQPPLGSANGNRRAVTHRQSRKLGRTAVLEAAPGLASEPFLPLLPRSAARCPQHADGSAVGAGGSPGPPSPPLLRPWEHREGHRVSAPTPDPSTRDSGTYHVPGAAPGAGEAAYTPFSGSLVRGGAGRKPTSAPRGAARTGRKKAPVREQWGWRRQRESVRAPEPDRHPGGRGRAAQAVLGPPDTSWC